MVMRKPEPAVNVTSNTMVVALAALIVLLGAGFLFAYDSLRSHRAAIASVALSAPAKDGERPKYRGEDDYDALIDLGIDPDDSSLSPAARKVIDRAHRAAMEAGGQGSGTADDGDAAIGADAGTDTVPAPDADLLPPGADAPAAPPLPSDL